MKGLGWVELGAAAVGAYLLFKSRDSDDSAGSSAANLGPPDAAASFTIRTPQGTGELLTQSRFGSVADGVQKLNEAVNAGQRVDAGGRTISRLSQDQKVNVKLPSGVTETYSGGTISKLATGETKYVSVKQPARDSSGATAWDRRIAKNVAAKK